MARLTPRLASLEGAVMVDRALAKHGADAEQIIKALRRAGWVHKDELDDAQLPRRAASKIPMDVQQVWDEYVRLAVEPFGREATLTPARVKQIQKAIDAADGGAEKVMAALRGNVFYWYGAAPDRFNNGVKSQIQIAELISPGMKLQGTNATDYLERSAQQDPGPSWMPGEPLTPPAPRTWGDAEAEAEIERIKDWLIAWHRSSEIGRVSREMFLEKVQQAHRGLIRFGIGCMVDDHGRLQFYNTTNA